MKVILGINDARHVTELQKHLAEEDTSCVGVWHLGQTLAHGATAD